MNTLPTNIKTDTIEYMADHFGYDVEAAAADFDRANADGAVAAWYTELWAEMVERNIDGYHDARDDAIAELAEYVKHKSGGWSPLGDELRSLAAEASEEYDDVPQDVLDWEADDELRAEFTMSFVCGGGRAEDAAARYSLKDEFGF